MKKVIKYCDRCKEKVDDLDTVEVAGRRVELCYSCQSSLLGWCKGLVLNNSVFKEPVDTKNVYEVYNSEDTSYGEYDRQYIIASNIGEAIEIAEEVDHGNWEVCDKYDLYTSKVILKIRG